MKFPFGLSRLALPLFLLVAVLARVVEDGSAHALRRQGGCARAQPLGNAQLLQNGVAPHANPPVFRVEDTGPGTCSTHGDRGDNEGDSGGNH